MATRAASKSNGTAAPRQVELVDLETLVPHPDNPKQHDLGLMRQSVGTFGYIEPIVVDGRTGFLISGHGRRDLLLDQRAKGEQPPDGVVLDPSSGRWLVPVVQGWASRSDAEARAALVTLNRTGEVGGWDKDKLLEVLQAASADDLLAVTGYTDADVARMLKPPSDGSLLARSDVTLAEPSVEVHHGEVFAIRERHRLVIADVMRDWPLWSPMLSADALFVPYPGPYAALGVAADRHTLILVQPDAYIAGHLIDKTRAVHGDEAAVRLS
jgi:hypothetical protein